MGEPSRRFVKAIEDALCRPANTIRIADRKWGRALAERIAPAVLEDAARELGFEIQDEARS